MPRRINMKRLIRAHQVDYDLITVDEATGRYDDAGEWVEPKEVRETRQAVILPLGERNVYELGGRSFFCRAIFILFIKYTIS